MKQFLLILALCLLATYTAAQETTDEPIPTETDMEEEPMPSETLMDDTKDWNGVLLDGFYAKSGNVTRLGNCWKLCASDSRKGCVAVAMGPKGSTHSKTCWRYKAGFHCRKVAAWRSRVLSSTNCSN
jgi:hypothetical protein